MSIRELDIGIFKLVDHHADTPEYYEVAISLYENEMIYQSLVALRRRFGIPDHGFRTMKELDEFRQRIRKQALDVDDIQDILEIKFSNEIIDLARSVGVSKSFTPFVELCVLCPEVPPDALVLQRNGAIRIKTPIVAAQGYEVSWLSLREPGVKINIHRKLTKNEWARLRAEVDQLLAQEDAETKQRARKNAHADFLAFRALREGGGFYDAYDAVYRSEDDVKVDKKKEEALRKRIKRTKQRKKNRGHEA